MKLCVLCGSAYTNLHARLIPLLEELKKYGVNYDLIICTTKNTSYRILEIVKKVANKEPDTIIISTLSSVSIWLLQKICKSLSRKTKILFDACDPVFLSNVKLLNGFYIRSPAFSCFEKVVKSADAVTASSHFTLRYMLLVNRNASIIHDPIDVSRIIPKKERKSDKITIGWQGNPNAHIDNLTMLVKPLECIAKDYDVKFKIVSWLGNMKVKQIFERLEKHAEIDYGSNRWLLLDDHVNLVCDFDIMVAPLRRTLWYEGKSALRVGIGMAMGIPVVASPVGEQKYVIKHGVNGFLADGEEEWYKYLKLLIEDDDLRRRIGREGRKTAEKELSLEVNGRRLYNIIESCVYSEKYEHV